MQWRNLQEWNTPPHWWRWHLLIEFLCHTLGITPTKKWQLSLWWSNFARANIICYTFFAYDASRSWTKSIFGGSPPLRIIASLSIAVVWGGSVRCSTFFFLAVNCKVCLGAKSKTLRNPWISQSLGDPKCHVDKLTRPSTKRPSLDFAAMPTFSRFVEVFERNSEICQHAWHVVETGWPGRWKFISRCQGACANVSKTCKPQAK